MSNFRIKKVNNMLSLEGHLLDSTEIENFLDLLLECTDIDFAPLYSVTWNGLSRLISLLSQIPLKFKLYNIPVNIYKIIMLFPEISEKIFPQSFFIEKIMNNGEIIKDLVEMDKLVEVGLNNGNFMYTDNYKVRFSLHYLCRPALGSAELPPFTVQSIDLENYKEQLLCWYDYTNFVQIIIETCSLSQRSTTVHIEENLQRILLRTLNIQQAYKLINPNIKEFKTRDLLELLPYVQGISNKILVEIKAHGEKFSIFLDKLQDYYIDKKSNYEKIISFVKELNFLILGLSSITHDLEQVGLDIGEKVFSFGEVIYMKKLFEEVDESFVTDKFISSVRRKFKFVNTEEVMTWDKTLVEISKEFKLLQDELNKCIISMQGYDLIRQILEHRLNEANILLEMFSLLEQDINNWQMITDVMLDLAMSKLVTDQEKFAFSFFFPTRKYRSETTLSSGDITFF